VKVIAIVIAGGSGKRMAQEIPKQFITVYDKPILIYTLENMQSHPQIDAIEVVCIDGWEHVVSAYAKKYRIDKLKWIARGGETAQESIRNGVYSLEKECAEEDVVIIHDGIRPIMDDAVITDVIDVCKRHGNAVTSMPYFEQLMCTSDGKTTVEFVTRDTIRRVSTPQAYRYGLLLSSYKEAFAKEIGIYGSHYTNTMLVELGITLHFALGSEKNIKITTPEDIEIFKALLNAQSDKAGRERIAV
jgi:2-C-methyl-D-erythritol 4-phosphate cytidylyltransferase